MNEADRKEDGFWNRKNSSSRFLLQVVSKGSYLLMVEDLGGL
jgi:hypothetical protein